MVSTDTSRPERLSLPSDVGATFVPTVSTTTAPRSVMSLKNHLLAANNACQAAHTRLLARLLARDGKVSVRCPLRSASLQVKMAVRNKQIKSSRRKAWV